MFNVVQQMVGEILRSDPAFTESKAKMRRLLQWNAIAGTIIQWALSSPGFIVPIFETVWKMLDRAVVEKSPPNIEDASRNVAEVERLIGRRLLCNTTVENTARPWVAGGTRP